jgi:hypothetical protein
MDCLLLLKVLRSIGWEGALKATLSLAFFRANLSLQFPVVLSMHSVTSMIPMMVYVDLLLSVSDWRSRRCCGHLHDFTMPPIVLPFVAKQRGKFWEAPAIEFLYDSCLAIQSVDRGNFTSETAGPIYIRAPKGCVLFLTHERRPTHSSPSRKISKSLQKGKYDTLPRSRLQNPELTSTGVHGLL